MASFSEFGVCATADAEVISLSSVVEDLNKLSNVFREMKATEYL